MRTPNHSLVLLALCAASSLLCVTQPAHAVLLQTYVTSIYQIGTTAGVRVGHRAHAYTDFNRLTVGGTYEILCQSFYIVPSRGQRQESTSTLLCPTHLTVTIPQWIPSQVNLSGFSEVPRGTTVSCTYNWTARATEGQLTIGSGGSSTIIGGGEAARGGSVPFTMRTLSLGDGGDRVPCIP